MEVWNIILDIGENKEYHTLSDAVANIPVGASQVLINIHSDLIQTTDITLPTNCNIHKLKITSFQDRPRTIDFSRCSFFANSIHIIIDSSITFINCFLFGGGKAEYGKSTIYHTSHLQINGIVDYVFGGGYANGSKSISTVEEPLVELSGGIVSYLYGGGFAIHHGSVNSARINILLDSHSTITGILNGGNFLAGPECNSTVGDINLNISGKIKGNIILAGYGAYNSSIRIQNSICLYAKEAELSGKIQEKSSNNTEFITNDLRIQGEINSKYQNLLKVSNSDIRFVQQESMNMSGSITPKSDYTVPYKSKTDKTEEAYNQVISKKKKNIWGCIIACVILLTMIFIFLSWRNDNKKLIQNRTVSVADNHETQNKITEIMVIATTDKSNILTTETILPTQSNYLIVTIVPTPTNTSAQTETMPIVSIKSITSTPTYVQQEMTPTINVESVTPTPAYVQAETMTMVSVGSITPIPSKTSAKTFVETDTIEPTTESEIKKAGIIYVEADSGTIFYRVPDKNQENVIRTLKNNTEVEIVSGPTYRNGYEWYEIYCLEFNRSGWVISNSVKFESN